MINHVHEVLWWISPCVCICVLLFCVALQSLFSESNTWAWPSAAVPCSMKVVQLMLQSTCGWPLLMIPSTMNYWNNVRRRVEKSYANMQSREYWQDHSFPTQCITEGRAWHFLHGQKSLNNRPRSCGQSGNGDRLVLKLLYHNMATSLVESVISNSEWLRMCSEKLVYLRLTL